MALLCSRCVESQPAEDAANFCNGDCRWTGEKCVLRADRLINCGGHRAKTCAQCPDGHGGGWCHGDCMWLSEKCVVATLKNQAAAQKEDKKVQSHPHFRPGGSWLSWLIGVRSEPEPSPETLYTGFVRNLVGTTISRTVQDAGKDVLVNCYAPWCGHCHEPRLLLEGAGETSLPCLDRGHRSDGLYTQRSGPALGIGVRLSNNRPLPQRRREWDDRVLRWKPQAGRHDQMAAYKGRHIFL